MSLLRYFFQITDAINVGSNGAKTIREVKFNKKMDAMRKSGMSWD